MGSMSFNRKLSSTAFFSHWWTIHSPPTFSATRQVGVVERVGLMGTGEGDDRDMAVLRHLEVGVIHVAAHDASVGIGSFGAVWHEWRRDDRLVLLLRAVGPCSNRALRALREDRSPAVLMIDDSGAGLRRVQSDLRRQ